MKRFEDRMDLDGKNGKFHRVFREMDKGRIPVNPNKKMKMPAYCKILQDLA